MNQPQPQHPHTASSLLANILLQTPRAWLLLFVLWMPGVFAQVTLSIDGDGDAAIEEQLKAYLVIPAGAKFEDSNLLESLTKTATQAMQAIGYYEASFIIEDEIDGDNVELTLTVTPGDPARVTQLVVEISGEGQNDKVFQSLDETKKVAIGEIFHHGHYESLKSKIANNAQAFGYFDGHFERNKVTLDVANNSAAIDLHFASGERYSLGEVTFVGLPLKESLIRHWVSFKPGTPYQSKLVADLTNSLLDSGYFSNVRVIPERNNAVDGVIPIRVELTENADNTVSFGIGFATDTGPRGQVSWDKPLINRNGHSFHSEMTVSQIRQSVSARYKMPTTGAPRTNYYVLETGAQKETIDNRIDRLLTVSGQHVSLTKSRWQQTESLRWEDYRFTVSDVTRDTTLYLPGIGWSRTQRRGGVFPTWGNRYSLRLQGANRSLGSDVDMAKVIASGKWLRSFGNNHYLLFRSELGALNTNEFDALPLAHRFFAGGDQSVRGFGYQTIGPKDSAGNVIGGRYLAVGSVEAVFSINDSWGWALFTDAGKAFDTSSEGYKVGVGAGIRWRSPVGPLRIDLAVGVSEDDNPIRLHLAIGPEL